MTGLFYEMSKLSWNITIHDDTSVILLSTTRKTLKPSLRLVCSQPPPPEAKTPGMWKTVRHNVSEWKVARRQEHSLDPLGTTVVAMFLLGS